MAEPIPAPRRLVYKLFRNPALWVFVVTLAILAIHPIPECVDCEFPHPWGRDDLAYHHASAILDVWFVVASITAGFYSVRRYWLVPVSIALAHSTVERCRAVVAVVQRRASDFAPRICCWRGRPDGGCNHAVLC